MDRIRDAAIPGLGFLLPLAHWVDFLTGLIGLLTVVGSCILVWLNVVLARRKLTQKKDHSGASPF